MPEEDSELECHNSCSLSGTIKVGDGGHSKEGSIIPHQQHPQQYSALPAPWSHRVAPTRRSDARCPASPVLGPPREGVHGGQLHTTHNGSARGLARATWWQPSHLGALGPSPQPTEPAIGSLPGVSQAQRCLRHCHCKSQPRDEQPNPREGWWDRERGGWWGAGDGNKAADQLHGSARRRGTPKPQETQLQGGQHTAATSTQQGLAKMQGCPQLGGPQGSH